VIKRLPGQRIAIGEGPSMVTVEVLPPNGAGARLLVEAPRSTLIRREVPGADA
jgi:sRNA-binding carbon storage regulator CsrA